MGAVLDPSYAAIRYGRKAASGVLGSLLTEGDDDYAVLRGVETGRWASLNGTGTGLAKISNAA